MSDFDVIDFKIKFTLEQFLQSFIWFVATMAKAFKFLASATASDIRNWWSVRDNRLAVGLYLVVCPLVLSWMVGLIMIAVAG